MAVTLITKRIGCSVSKRSVRFYSAPGDGVVPPAKQKYVPTDGTYPQGFLAASAHVGVKASNTRFDDLALIASETPCSAAAVFTKNKFQAAPVTVTRDMLKSRNGSGVRAVVVNSGCANAVTGKGGLEDARKMGEETDKHLGGSSAGDGQGLSTVVMSTGVIGQRLPISKILNKIPTAISGLGNTHDHWLATARAICTTDTFPKLISRSFTLPSYPGTTFQLAGMTKGAGMIHPNMATLLSIICTDAPVSPPALQAALTSSVNRSFNSISVDGDTSTNDTCAILANGAASSSSHPDKSISSTDMNDPDFSAFTTALTGLTTSLSQLIVRDGEGATKFVTIRVLGAQSREVGHKIASTIATSPLVKTALYGRDANWGRILCAIGYADGLPDGAVVPEKVSVSFVPATTASAAAAGPPTGKTGAAPMTTDDRKEAPVEEEGELRLLIDGEPQNVDEAKAAKMLAEEDLEILVRMKPASEMSGTEEEVLFWTCDFSHEYVTINGDYRT